MLGVDLCCFSHHHHHHHHHHFILNINSDFIYYLFIYLIIHLLNIHTVINICFRSCLCIWQHAAGQICNANDTQKV